VFLVAAIQFAAVNNNAQYRAQQQQQQYQGQLQQNQNAQSDYPARIQANYSLRARYCRRTYRLSPWCLADALWQLAPAERCAPGR